MPACKKCSKKFNIESEDKQFYQKISVPEPTHCPDCREQRRLSWRNERSLYARQCDCCKKNIISVYNKDAKFPVYCPDCWWSDKHDPKQNARDFDFSRPFFEQFKELEDKVPHISLMNKRSQNSEYVNDANSCKNSYLLFGCDYCEDSYYGAMSIKQKNSMDFYWCIACEECYEGVDNANCYNSHFCQFSDKLTDSWFCYDCSGLQNCFACFGLHHKQYYILNKEYSKEEYFKILAGFELHTKEGLTKVKKDYKEALLKYPRRYATAIKCENCTGDVMVNCEDSKFVFDVRELKDCKYVYNGFELKDSYDASVCGLDQSELLYEAQTCLYKGHKIFFSVFCWYCNNTEYSQFCFNSQDVFGSFGLKKARNYIFNKEYDDEAEYKKQKQKIIEHMKKTGEYGEFFPSKLSPFKYIDTAAQDFFPIKQEKQKKPVDKKLPVCVDCEQNFKIIPQEQKFYDDKKLPAPEKCPTCRHQDRMKKKNPRKLHHGQCMCELESHEHKGRCPNEFETTYNPERPEIIYCEKCYQAEIY